MRKLKYHLHGEDITWVVDQILKTFHTLQLHLSSKKRPFPNDAQVHNILKFTKERIDEEYNDKQ